MENSSDSTAGQVTLLLMGDLVTKFNNVLTDIANEIQIYWYILAALHIAVIVFGALSTSLVAIQTNTTSNFVKYSAILSTAILTILSSAQSTFHIRENSSAMIKLHNECIGRLSTIASRNVDKSTTDVALSDRIQMANDIDYCRNQEVFIRTNIGNSDSIKDSNSGSKKSD
jgi:hypothetical protein